MKKRVLTYKVIHGVLEEFETKSRKQFFSDGLKTLQEHKLISAMDAEMIARLPGAKTREHWNELLATIEKSTRSRFIKAELIPSMRLIADRDTAPTGPEATTYASTGAGTASIIIIGATAAGAGIGTAIGGPGTGTVIGAAVGMLVGGALAVGAIGADGDGGAVEGGDGGGDGGG